MHAQPDQASVTARVSDCRRHEAPVAEGPSGQPEPVACGTAEDRAAPDAAARKNIRGSFLLLVGRLLALGINFAAQVLTVRFLSKQDFGAFAYAQSMVSLAASVAVLGLDKAITRFVPIYHEQGNYNKVFGTIVMMVGTVFALGATIVAAAFALRGVIVESVASSPLSVTLLLVLIALAPVQAFDSLLLGLFATFAGPRAIFLRKHVLGPGLKLAAVAVLILAHSNVRILALAYLVSGVLGTAAYAAILVRILSQQGILRHFRLRSMEMPFREVFGFSIPLLSSDVVFLMRTALVVFLLDYFGSTSGVAEFRAVLPVAKLNLVVFESFRFLFMPRAARMFARKDSEGVNDFYWETAIWITTLSFPIFAVSFAMARPVVVLLFGARYAGSGMVLALLSLGYYCNAALGFNALTLKVFGAVRYIVLVDAVAALAGLGASLALIPRFGALGGAIATCGTLILHNLLYQLGLARAGVSLFRWRYGRVYCLIAAASCVLVVLEWAMAPPIYVAALAAGLVSLLVLRLNRDLLGIDRVFPELGRMAITRHLLGVSGRVL